MGNVNLVIDLLFCADFVKNHFTGYIDKNVNVVVDPWLIKLNYWKSWSVPAPRPIYCEGTPSALPYPRHHTTATQVTPNFLFCPRAIPDIVSSFPYDLALDFYAFYLADDSLRSGSGAGASSQSKDLFHDVSHVSARCPSATAASIHPVRCRRPRLPHRPAPLPQRVRPRLLNPSNFCASPKFCG